MHYLGDEWIHKLENMISKIARELPTDQIKKKKFSFLYRGIRRSTGRSHVSTELAYHANKACPSTKIFPGSGIAV